MNDLQKEIDELTEFLYVVVKFDKDSQAIPSTNVFMTKTVDVKITLFGARNFGCGSHSQTINIPDTIRNDLIELAEKRLVILKDELSSMFK